MSECTCEADEYFCPLHACICHSWDGRGYSVCGLKCPAHPPENNCKDTECKRMVHGDRYCAHCAFAKYGEEE